MGDWAQGQDYNSIVISNGSPCACVEGAWLGAGSGASRAWPAANRAIFVPFVVYQPFLAVKMLTTTGGTASGNLDIGIYDDHQNRLASMGSTAQASAFTLQSFDIADTLLLPGVYYMALCIDNTTATILAQAPLVSACGALGVLSQSVGAVTLPAPAAFAAAQDAYVPIISVTGRALI
jgi:hypothetical protein